MLLIALVTLVAVLLATTTMQRAFPFESFMAFALVGVVMAGLLVVGQLG